MQKHAHSIVFEVSIKDRAPAPAAVYTTNMQAQPPLGLKFANGSIQESVPLQPGDDGFVVAHFADGPKSFPNMPNLTLSKLGQGTHMPPATKAAAKANAKATAKAKANAKAAAPGPKKAILKRPAAHDGSSYGPMYYKHTFSIGIRQRFGTKQQIACFGGKSCRKKSKEEMVKIGYDMCKELDEGASIDSVKTEGNRLASALDDVA